MILLIIGYSLMVIAILGFCIYLLLTTGTYWSVRNKKYIKENEKALKNQIVFYGDSITEFFNLHKYFPKEYVLYNRGIGGDTTDGLLKRIETNVICIKPAKIFLMIGTNDLIKKDAEHVLTNYKRILDEFCESLPDCKVIIESIYPVNDTINFFVKNRNKEIIKINEGLKKMADEYNYTYIDVFSHLLDYNKNKLKKEYTLDGLHLSEEGYVVVSNILVQYLKEE